MRAEREHKKNACPNTEVLLLLTDDSADPWLRKAYESHLEQCHACAELDRRLLRFAQSALIDHPEWSGTEKRLDNWMEGYLQSRQGASTADTTRDTRHGRARWRDVWAEAPWKISLATGVLALLVVAFVTYPKWEMDRHDKSSQLARVHHEEEARISADHATELPAEPVTSVERPASHPSSGVTGSRKWDSQTATVNTDGLPQSGKKLPNQTKEPSDRVSADRQSASSSDNDARSSLAMKSPSPVLPKPETVTSASPGKGCAFCSSVRPANTATSDAIPGIAGTVPRNDTAPALPLRSLQLASGTRLWISVEWAKPQPNGSMAFRGSLLLPLRDATSSNLEHGTRVAGSVVVEHGRRYLSLVEIIIKGTHYKLRSDAKGGGVAQASGSGNAVQFDSGRVLELWLSADSIYEASAADSCQ
jgi:hypothetical protein